MSNQEMAWGLLALTLVLLVFAAMQGLVYLTVQLWLTLSLALALTFPHNRRSR